jgi:DNA end-binding protein Ku
MARRKASSTKRAEGRASWQGNLTFGLVSFAVEAFNAINRRESDIHFNQLHAECHSRIRYEKVCPIHGKVGNDEIVSGYEYQKGRYVEFDPDELADLQSEQDRALKIDAFVAPDEVDPLYFDGRMYYLMPADDAAKEPYGVILTAMEKEQRYGVGQVVFSRKDQIALIRPVDGVLHMAMLNYEVEIRSAKEFAGHLRKPAKAARQLSLAQSLIREWSDEKFDFSSYEDTYRERVAKLIEAKVKGKEIVEPEAEEEEPTTINLMEALKKSLAKTRRPAHSRRSTKSRKHSA